MKRCSDPQCSQAVWFDDSLTVCPFCAGKLLPVPGTGSAPAVTPASVPAGTGAAPKDQFLRRCFSHVTCHGVITEIAGKDLFNDTDKKLIDTLLLGRPFQFAHQTSQYAIRVEPVPGNAAAPVQAHTFYTFGDFMGGIMPGDEVVIRAKHHLFSGQDIAKTIYNVTTRSRVRPLSIQIPGGFVQRAVIGTLGLSAFLLIMAALSSAAGIAELAVITAAGAVGLLAVFVWGIKALFRKR